MAPSAKKRLVASSIWAYLNDEKALDCGHDNYASCEDSKVKKLIEVAEEVRKHFTNKVYQNFRTGKIKNPNFKQ